VLGALALVALMLMAGLGVEVGFLRYQKQQMQKAADAGAIAGAAELIYGSPALAIVAAQNDATANGFANGQNGITVQVNIPPQSGPFTGNSGYVEVIVAQAQPAFFVRVGGSYNSVNVRSRAVASSLGSASGCIYALDPTDSATFTAAGSVNISSNCGIRVNSNSASAFYKTGSGNISVDRADGIGVVGGVSEAGSGTITPQPREGIPAFGDPLSGVPAPPVGSCTRTTPYTLNTPSGGNVPQGVYCGGIVIATNGPVSFDSGTIVVMNGLTVSPGFSPTLTGSGVTFYNTGNASYPYLPVTITGSASSTLSAPTSGSLAGILVFQDRSIVDCCGPATVNTIDASHGEIYTGAFYFPTTPVTYTANSTFPPYVIIDAWQVAMVGTSAIGATYTSLPNGASPIHSAALVE
jgi:Flp pilus assembly protein TadG